MIERLLQIGGVQEGPLEAETFKWDVKGKKETGMRKLGGRALQTQRTAGAKAPKQECAVGLERTVKRPVCQKKYK